MSFVGLRSRSEYDSVRKVRKVFLTVPSFAMHTNLVYSETSLTLYSGIVHLMPDSSKVTEYLGHALI